MVVSIALTRITPPPHPRPGREGGVFFKHKAPDTGIHEEKNPPNLSAVFEVKPFSALSYI
jgi:hypothetical protein